MRSLGLSLLVIAYLATISPGTPVDAASPYSAEFCIKDHYSLRFFDVKQIGPNAMKFGFADIPGEVMSVYGVAHRVGPHHWRFLSVDAPDPNDHCQLDFRLDEARRTLETWGNPAIACTNDGGSAMSVGHFYFRSPSYRGRVTNQLANQSQFFEKGGRC